MAAYGINKPIFQSEAALKSTTGGEAFEQAKADYLVWVFSRNMAEGLLGTTWYTLNGPGWEFSGLLDTNQAPLPAYQALKFAVRELTGRVYNISISYPGVNGFQFSRGSSKVWALFSQDNSAHTVPVPANFSTAYDISGKPILPADGVLMVDHPIYIELNP
jgi:hypothetical protein